MLPLSAQPAERRPRCTRARTLGTLVALALLVASAVVPSTHAGAAPEDDIAAKREEARRLEAAIAEGGRRISILDEEFNALGLRIASTSARLVDAERRLDDARAQSAQVRDEVRERAASLYKRSGLVTPLSQFEAEEAIDVGVRAKYSAAAAAQDDELLDQLAVAGELLRERRHELERTRSRALAQQEGLEQKRAEIEAAQDEQEALLAQVRGEIAELVRQEQERREREAAERAKAELERRLAAERAARERAARERDGRGGGDLAAPDVPAPNPNAQIAVDTAKAQLGKPYRYAAAGPDEFDCSGLTLYAWAAAGVSLPHSSRAQFAGLPHVPMDALAPGDLVFYGSPIHHVGVYLGDGAYVHAPQTGDVVKISSIYRSDWAGAARPG